MDEIIVAPAWRSAFPGACTGFLAMRSVGNPERHEALDRRKEDLEADLRAHFAGKDRSVLLALPAIEAYSAYYKRFSKTYHVLLQLESVALKGRSIPRVAALVEAMFMAELKSQLLTAGHDLDLVQTPVTVGVAAGTESYTMLNGKQQTLAAGDMFMSDGQGVISAVIHGPDQRTCIRPTTTRVLFAVYAPAGIGETAVQKHLDDIRNNVLLIAPAAETEMQRVYAAQT